MFRHTLFYALKVYFVSNCSVENCSYIFDLAHTCEVKTCREVSPFYPCPAEHTSVCLEKEEEMRVRGQGIPCLGKHKIICIPTISEKTGTKPGSRCRKDYGAKSQCAASSSLHFWEQKELVWLQWLRWLWQSNPITYLAFMWTNYQKQLSFHYVSFCIFIVLSMMGGWPRKKAQQWILL